MTDAADGATTDTAAEDVLTSSIATRFVEALRALEEHGDIGDMVSLGGEETRWWSTGPDRVQVGPEGAERFWSGYRQAFADIRSDFTAVTETPGRIVLEWRSRGRHHDGAGVDYAGATVLDIGGSTTDPGLTAVRLYFDTAAALVATPGP